MGFEKVAEVIYESVVPKLRGNHKYSDKFSVQISIHLSLVHLAKTEEFKTGKYYLLMISLSQQTLLLQN